MSGAGVYKQEGNMDKAGQAEDKDIRAAIDALAILRKSGMIEESAARETMKKINNDKRAKVLDVHNENICTLTVQHHGKTEEVVQTHYKDPKTGKRKTKRIKVKGSIQEAEEEIYSFLYDLYFGSSKEECSIKALFEPAIQEHMRLNNLRPTTLTSYRRNCHELIEPYHIYRKDVRKITRKGVLEYMQTMAQEHAVTLQRLKNVKTILNIIFEYAIDKGIININPMPKNNAPFHNSLKNDYKPPEEKALQRDEVAELEAYCWKQVKKSYSPYAAAILLSIYTGERRAEIVGLRWSDLSDDFYELHIAQQYVVDKDEATGKQCYRELKWTKAEKGQSHGGRHIGLTEKARDLLKVHKVAQEAVGRAGEWIFTTATSSDVMKVTGYTKHLHDIGTKLGLTTTRNHALRMSLNSYVLAPSGMDAAKRAQYLGHSVTTNERYYTFADKEDAVRTASQMDAFYKKEANERNGLRNQSGKVTQFPGNPRQRRKVDEA